MARRSGGQKADACLGSQGRIRQPVVEAIRMRTTGRDVDDHAACKSGERVGSRVRHDRDRLLGLAKGQRRTVLKHEATSAAIEGTVYRLHRDVAGRAGDCAAERDHFARTRRLQGAVVQLVDGHSSKAAVLGNGAQGLRSEFDVERSGREVGNHEVHLG